jgi:hypothetical protein
MKRIATIIIGITMLGCTLHSSKKEKKEKTLRQDFIESIAEGFYDGDTTRVRNIKQLCIR